jgi:hypothetical protein
MNMLETNSYIVPSKNLNRKIPPNVLARADRVIK